MRRIRRSVVPATLAAGALLFGAVACDDGGDTGGTTDTTGTDTGTVDTGTTDDTGGLTDTGTETEPTG